MKRPSMWLIAVLAIALLAGCSKSPESTIESFYRAIAKGEVTEARGYVSAQLVGMLGEQKLSAALSNEAQRIQACGGIKSIDVKLQGEGELRSGMATISYHGSCSPKTEQTKLIKEDGRWKITANK